MNSLVCILLLVTALSVNCHILHRPEILQYLQQDPTSPPIILDEAKFVKKELLSEEALDEEYVVDDMILTGEQWYAMRQRKAVNGTEHRWTEGPVSDDENRYPVVPYVYMSQELEVCKNSNCNDRYCERVCGSNFKAFPLDKKHLVEEAIQHWKNHTCIEFKDITSEPEDGIERKKPHLIFDGNLTTCSSNVGMHKKGNIIVGQLIRAVCPNKTFGSRVHEIGHAIGFYHEHTRSDRDKYIEIFKREDIESSNYRIQEDDNMTIEYDYSSVMHYDPYSGNRKVFSPKDPANLELTGDRSGLSFRDKHLANKMYKCIDKWESKCKSNMPKTCGSGYIGKTCTCVCPPHMEGSECEKDKPGYNKDYYHEKRSQKLNERITSAMTLTATVPDDTYERDVIFVKSIIPPKCKMAKVTFLSAEFENECDEIFMNVVTDPNDLKGKVFCAFDIFIHGLMNKIGQEIAEESSTGITINTVIKKGKKTDADIGKPLWKAEVTFEDIIGPDCPVSAKCSSIFEFSAPWDEANMRVISGWMTMPFPMTTSSWSVDLTFDQDINKFIMWNYDVAITSTRTVTLTPKYWNTQPKEGFKIKWVGSDIPKPISTKLNGKELC